MSAPSKLPPSRTHPLMAAVGIYILSLAVVMAGIAFGNACVPRRSHPTQLGPGFINSFSNWDGRWYAQITEDGYSYSTTEYSGAAFFPAYPCLAKVVSRIIGLRTDAALLCVSHICLISAMLVLALSVQGRGTHNPDRD